MADIKNEIAQGDRPPSYFSPTATSSDNALPASEITISSLPLTFPSRDASAPEVRTYLRSFLYHNAEKYDLGPGDAAAEAAAIAARWRHGSGQELRNFDRAAWEGLLGLEFAMVLSKHVEEYLAVQKEDAEHSSNTANIVCMAVSATIIIALFLLASQAPRDRGLAFGFAGFLSCFVAIGFIVPACFLAQNVLYNKRRAKEMSSGTAQITSRGEYMRVVEEEDSTELMRMEVA